MAIRRRRRSAARDRHIPVLSVGATILLALAFLPQDRLSAHAPVPPAHSRPAAAKEAAPSVEPLAVRTADLPGGFAPGACAGYDPTGFDLHRTIVVDAGHGGPDPGAVGGQVQEKTLTLAVALQLRDMLRSDGYRVVLTRTSDTSVAQLATSQVRQGAVTNSGVHLDTLARIACANASGADALVSIHFNAFSDPSVGGAETFYDDARSFAADNRSLAALVQASLMASYGRAGWTVEDRGIHSDAATGSSGLTATAEAYGRLMELGPASQGWNDKPSLMPGVLVEPSFLTDPFELQVASSIDGQRAIAAGIEQALIGFVTGGHR